MNQDDMSSGCAVPALQSAVTGFLFAVLAGALALWLDVDTRRALLFGLAAGGLAAVVTWTSGLRAWRRSAYPEPYQPEPTQIRAKAEPVRVEIVQDHGRHVDFIDLPATTDQLITLAQSVLAGGSLSEAAWTGSNGLFTRAEFANLRNELIKRGLAAWNNPHTPARGVTLTRGGLAAMRTFAAMGAGDSPTLRKTTIPKV